MTVAKGFWYACLCNSVGLASVLSSALSARAEMNDQARSAIDKDALDQVTSVSQLSDVKATDWAFQALQSLVERYGCIAGYLVLEQICDFSTLALIFRLRHLRQPSNRIFHSS